MDKKSITDQRNHLKQTLQQLTQDLQQLTTQQHTKQTHITLLQNQLKILDELDTNAHYKTQYEDMQQKYQKERERLEKLFRKYASTETECEKLREEITQWHEWYDYNKQIFDRLFNAPPLNPPDTTPPQPKQKTPARKTKNRTRTKNKKPQPPTFKK